MNGIVLIIITSCAAMSEPAGHRIAMRQDKDGAFEFYDRVAEQSFYPVGFCHVRFEEDALEDTPHALFRSEYFDLDHANRILAFMAAHGYNTVRIEVNVVESVKADRDLSLAYLDNLAAYIQRVRDHGMQTLLALPVCIPTPCLGNAGRKHFGDSDGRLFSPEAIKTQDTLLQDFVRSLRQTGAPMNALLGYELCARHCNGEALPDVQTTPDETERRQGTRAIMDEADSRVPMGEDLVAFYNRMAGAIKAVAPDALVGGALLPPEPASSTAGFYNAAELSQSNLDYISLRLIPCVTPDMGVAGMEALLDTFGLEGVPAKPLVMTFGFQGGSGPPDATAALLKTWQASAEERSIRGWLILACDRSEQEHAADRERRCFAPEGEAGILSVLAPTMPESPPPPRPIETDARVGVYIFPGWYRNTGTTDYDYSNHDEESEWRLVAQFAHPRPVLGFYDDSLPEVNDWHIHWAVEAGISWFAFDWYWNAGETRLLWSLEKGFLEAKYNEQMDFCIHWCNHGLDWREPLDFSADALVEMVAYMAERYFTRPNYLTIGGRPVLMIWDITSVFEANGGESAFAERVLPQLNMICRDHGLGDLYLIHVDNAPRRLAAVRTGDAITGYSYAHLTTTTPFGLPGAAPYAELVEALPAHWDMIAETARLPFIVGTQSGWDSTPRTLAHDRQPEHRWVRTDNTAELFKITLEEGRKRIQEDLPFFLVEAWNEWGEGSFIEPSRSHGFGHLEAIRNVFAPDAPPATWRRPCPDRVVAYSVLRDEELAAAHRREHKPDPPAPVWEPQVDVTVDPEDCAGHLIEEWVLDSENAVAGLHVNAAMRFDGIHDNAARFTVVGDDPHIVFEGAWDMPAADCAIVLELRYHGLSPLPAEFFWALDGEGFVSSNAQRYTWQAGETFRAYSLRFCSTEKTQGALTGFRIDLPDEMGAETDLRRARILYYGESQPAG